jgi:predicted P-loop ATPase
MIPQFQNLKQWIPYALIPRANNPLKTDKKPTVDWGDSATWRDYADGELLGFVFTDSDPYWFLDIDNAYVDGAWSSLATDLCARLAGAAVEISQSGRGLHIFGSGALPPHCNRGPHGLELYARDRFCAITGTGLTGDPDTRHDDAMADIIAQYFPPRPEELTPVQWTTEPVEGWDTTLADDNELIARACKQSDNSAQGRVGGLTFADLWTANADSLAHRWASSDSSGAGYDASAADGSLATRLAFWTGKDCERIERLMRQSALARDKWDSHPTYLVDTILGACAASSAVAQPRPAPEPNPVATADESWWIGGVTDSNKAKSNAVNAQVALSKLQFSFRYNERSLIFEWREPHYLTEPRFGTGWQPITDAALRYLVMTIATQLELVVTLEQVMQAACSLGDIATFDPIKDYINSLAGQHDGACRLDTWLTTYCAVDDTPIARQWARLTLIGMIARGLHPGCKWDFVLSLIGKQGAGKSSVPLILAGADAFYTGDLSELDQKQLIETASHAWVVELGEMGTQGRREAGHIKAMITRTTDVARLAYGRTATRLSRGFIFMGTDNNEQLFSDDTGNRRYWPVTVGDIDLAGLRRDRNQLLAEALAVFNAEFGGQAERVVLGEQWWAVAGETQDNYTIDDPWESRIAHLLSDPASIALPDTFNGESGWRIDAFTILAKLGETRVTSAAGRRLKPLMIADGWQRVKSSGARFYFKGQ